MILVLRDRETGEEPDEVGDVDAMVKKSKHRNLTMIKKEKEDEKTLNILTRKKYRNHGCLFHYDFISSGQ